MSLHYCDILAFIQASLVLLEFFLLLYFLASAVDSSFAEAFAAASFHAVFLAWHILLLSLRDQIPYYNS
jgi:hypothetical protein